MLHPSCLRRLTLPLLLAACAPVTAPHESASLAYMVDSDTDADTDALTDVDHDGDGYCAAAACSDGSLPGDCDDTNFVVHPGVATDLCNNLDEDCDGTLNEDCDDGFWEYDGSWYSIGDLRYSWDGARRFCQEQGGDVASLTTDAENDVIGTLAWNQVTTSFWIGLTDEEEEGEFQWLDGSPVIDTSWTDGEPNDNRGREDCTEYRILGDTNWNDIDCRGNTRIPLCELSCDLPWYVDADGDGDGTGAPFTTGCGELPAGVSLTGGDCADDDATVSSLNAEVCDGVSTSCSGLAEQSYDGRGADVENGSVTVTLEITDRYVITTVGLDWSMDEVPDDQMAGTLTSPAGTSVPFIHGETVSAFAGEITQGIWTLTLTDTGDDAEELQDWDIRIGAPEDDLDGDGFPACSDCDDANANAYPGAPEVADGFDADCDGLDLDEDGDGVDASVDCNDADPAIYPGAPEVLDGIDSDCDGLDLDADGDGADASIDCDDSDPALDPLAAMCVEEIDSDCDGVCDSADICDGDDATGDIDADGFCDAAVGGADLDCNDRNDIVYPGAPELECDGLDNDCDGNGFRAEYVGVYESALVQQGTTTFTLDVPEDVVVLDLDVSLGITHQSPGDLVVDLISPAGTTVRLLSNHGGVVDNVNLTLDDEASAVLPTTSVLSGSFLPHEPLSAFDGENGTGTWTLEIIDDGFFGLTFDSLTLSFDRDSNQDGDTSICDDCNDDNRTVGPTVVERDADGIDQDCDGFDFDGDGDGWEAAVDCDDDDATINPGVAGCVDDVDSDCDGVCDAVDLCEGDDASLDGDGDGYCAQDFAGSVVDCEDGDAAVSPGEIETCDGVDVNCRADDVRITASSTPVDGSFEGDATTTEFTLEVTDIATIGSLTVDLDLDIDSVTLFGVELTSPTGTTIEIMEPNAINQRLGGDQWLDAFTFDDDAAREIDDLNLPISGAARPTEPLSTFAGESIVGTWTLTVTPYYSDFGGTIHGWSLHVLAAESDADVDGFLACGDCDDGDANTNPDAIENLTDAVDNDCDGFDLDADNDGFNIFDDCDDNNPRVNPLAVESCFDGVDTDCDGTLPLDEYDLDGDGYRACEGDCRPNDDESYPGAPELCDGFDNDCDGLLGEDELDGDADGLSACDGDCVGDDAAWRDICPDEDGDGEFADTDCDDRNAAINSTTLGDVCNGIDDDCDGELDEDCSCLFLELNGSSYTLCEEERSFDEAQAACEADGGTLAIFETQDEFDDVDDAFFEAREWESFSAWMGLTDRDTEGTYVWLDGTALDWFFRGGTGNEAEDCILNDYAFFEETDCEETHAYTCEFTCGSWYTDDDGDGYGTGEPLFTGCGLPPVGAASVDGDCDDSNAAVSPALSLDCAAFDLDGDGTCAAATCADGSAPGDCDDADPTRYAGATEVCDGIDNDCDGIVPEFEPADGDGDGICDVDDLCQGDDSSGDSDGDNVCDDEDPCPLDRLDDMDDDGLCDSDPADVCIGNDLAGDLDDDGVCNDIDSCPFDAADDSDSDGNCDSVDLCVGDDSLGDADGDGICDEPVLCEGDESLGDDDGDGLCNVLLEVTEGADLTFDITGARPASRAYLLYSDIGEGGNFCHPTIDLCADLRQPAFGPNIRVAADGTAQFVVPNSAGGTRYYRAVWVDAAANQGESSNVVVLPSN